MRLAFAIAVTGAMVSGDAAVAREPLQAVLLAMCRNAAEQPEPVTAMERLTEDMDEADRKDVYDACILYQNGYKDGLKGALEIKREHEHEQAK